MSVSREVHLATLQALLDAAEYTPLLEKISEFQHSSEWSLLNSEIKLRTLHLQCEAFSRQGNVGKAGAIAEELYNMLTDVQSTVPGDLRCNILLAYARSKREQLDNDAAITIIHEALQCVPSDEHPNLYAGCLLTLGMIKQSTSQYEDAEQAFHGARKIYEASGNTLSTGTANVYLGMLMSDLDRYDEAFEYYQQGEAYYLQCNNKNGLASVYNNIGNVYQALDDYSAALSSYQKSLDLCIELNRDVTLSSVYINTGNIYYHLGEFEKSKDFYERALEISTRLGKHESMINCYNNLGATYAKMLDHDKSNELYELAIELHKKKNDEYGVMNSYVHLAEGYSDKGEYDRAIEILTKCLHFFQEKGIESKQCNILFGLGVCFHKKDASHDMQILAMNLLEQGYALATKSNRRYDMLQMARTLSDVNASLGQWEKSRTYFQQYHDLFAENNNISVKRQAEILEKNRRIAEIEKERQMQQVVARQQKELLFNMLPKDIAERILSGEQRIAEEKPSASIFFSDIVGFTRLARLLSAKDLVASLDELFSVYDKIAAQYGVEKIKTIGDSYMAACGVPEHVADHTYRMEQFALDVMSTTKQFTFGGHPVHIRIGIHVGPVIAGVIGLNRYSYDLWGDTVNLASRLESSGYVNRIHVSEDFVQEYKAQMHRMPNVALVGLTELKNTEAIKTYLYEDR